ncbi:MAG: hypothetical protein AABW65_00550 [Nanoarchaeota archaeon]
MIRYLTHKIYRDEETLKNYDPKMQESLVRQSKEECEIIVSRKTMLRAMDILGGYRLEQGIHCSEFELLINGCYVVLSDGWRLGKEGKLSVPSKTLIIHAENKNRASLEDLCRKLKLHSAQSSSYR